jgi:DNA-binding XRE family transcriptional regulator
MDKAKSERADQALRQYVKGGRTLVDIGTEFVHLREQRRLSQHDLAQRATLAPEAVEAIESGKRLPTRRCVPRQLPPRGSGAAVPSGRGIYV